MSKGLTNAELKAISELLKEASNEYANHGCNDHYLPNTEENRNMLIEMIRVCFGKEDREEEIGKITPHKKSLFTYDWLLMSYLADRCKEAAK